MLILWLKSLPIVRLFVLPRSARSSFQWICTFIIVVTSGLGLWRGSFAHIANIALIILFVTVTVIPYSFWIAGKLCIDVGVRLSRSTIQHPYIAEVSWRRIVTAVPDVVFILWGLCYVVGYSSRHTNRAVFIIWILYFTIGNIIGIFNAFREWRLCQQARPTLKGGSSY